MVGIALEQHPDRTRLFMQWKKMAWPVMVDPFNLLGLPLVPVTLAVDEYGIIQAVHPRLDRADEFKTLFVDETFDAPDNLPAFETAVPDLDAMQRQAEKGGAEAWGRYANALTLWGDTKQLPDAVAAAKKALSLQNDDRTHFNLGVIYRKRYDSNMRQDGDFLNAVMHWTAALNHDPNNYIWRRRIQQYGPRLDKPYPFYDWVPQARTEISARNETPQQLIVEPGGAEFAQPAKEFTSNGGGQQTEPDADGRIHRDEDPLVDVEVVIVPPAIVPGDSARVHITMRPKHDAHWNNEVDDTVLWIDSPDNWALESQLLSTPNPQQVTSHEARHFEFEIHASQNAAAGQVGFEAYSLYYICEDVNGICLYRRQDIPLTLQINEPDARRLRDGG